MQEVWGLIFYELLHTAVEQYQSHTNSQSQQEFKPEKDLSLPLPPPPHFFLVGWFVFSRHSLLLKICRQMLPLQQPLPCKGPWHAIAVTRSTKRKHFLGHVVQHADMPVTATTASTAQAQHSITTSPLGYIKNGFMQCLIGAPQAFCESSTRIYGTQTGNWQKETNM